MYNLQSTEDRAICSIRLLVIKLQIAKTFYEYKISSETAIWNKMSETWFAHMFEKYSLINNKFDNLFYSLVQLNLTFFIDHKLSNTIKFLKGLRYNKIYNDKNNLMSQIQLYGFNYI